VAVPVCVVPLLFVVSYPLLLVRWPCISPFTSIMPYTTIIFLFLLALSTPSHRGSPHAHLRFIVFKRYSPPGHLTLALYTRRRQTLLLSLVIFIYMSTIFSRKRYSTIPITNTRIFLLYYSWLVALSLPYNLISLIYCSDYYLITGYIHTYPFSVVLLLV